MSESSTERKARKMVEIVLTAEEAEILQIALLVMNKAMVDRAERDPSGSRVDGTVALVEASIRINEKLGGAK